MVFYFELEHARSLLLLDSLYNKSLDNLLHLDGFLHKLRNARLVGHVPVSLELAPRLLPRLVQRPSIALERLPLRLQQVPVRRNCKHPQIAAFHHCFFFFNLLVP
ncbi:hypothetical protein AYI69_g3164 [Smittium culicis]|uniref:Uncharacterized protein n=1 Tax=Smittium culicis TaxID=133412 RepID=A0A1R1YKE9_9FUNG|nr:hypothetical protein AYI69_g3164 [Smittium culicis]